MTTYFGFKKVAENERQGLINEVFTSVAGRYDLMNDLMSFGLHRWWKEVFVRQVPITEGATILDMAGGTGDIAFRLLKKARAKGKYIYVTVADINDEMLKKGRARAVDRNILEGISWQQANAETLSFQDNSFDAYTIAFGIRNVTHIDKALKEAYRVLKPGGKFLCLEFSPVETPLFAKLYDAYSLGVIPKIGEVVTGDKEAYQYLVESIRKFPKREEFVSLIKTAGFVQAKVMSLTQGVVAIHTGWKV